MMLVLWNRLGGSSDITLPPTRKADSRCMSGMQGGSDCRRQRRHCDGTKSVAVCLKLK